MTYRLEPASRLLVGLVVIVFLLGAFFLTRTPPAPPEEQIQVDQPTIASSQPLPEYSFREERIQESDPVLPYLLNVTYPVFTADQAALDAINKTIELWVRERIAFFLQEGTKRPTIEDELFGKSSYHLRYTTRLFPETSDAKVMHTTFVETPFFAGAAHPGLHQHIFLFDLENGSEMGLETFLKTDTASLTTLRKLLIAALEEQQRLRQTEESEIFVQKEQRLEWEDTLKQRENLETFSLTEDGLVFSFDPYIVGSYAEGIQEILLPASELDKNGLLTERGENIFPDILKPYRFLEKQP